MLKQLRDKGGSIVVKVLMGLLVLSFAAWGIGDIFSPNSAGQSVANAGKTEVTQQEFLVQLRQQEASLRARGFSQEMLGNINLPAVVVDQLVTRATYEEEARQMNLVPTAEVIGRTIRDTPDFQDAAGNFDRNRYEFSLANQGYNPAYFENLVSKDVVANMLLDSVSAGVATSDIATKALYKFQKETRDISYISIAIDENEAISEPSVDALNSYYETNKERFRAPDYRKVSYIAIDPDMIAADIQISDAAILESYEQRLDQFTDAEQRTIQLMLLSDEAAALAAKESIEAGKSFAEVAIEAANQGEDEINLGTMTRAEVPDENLGNVAFDLALGAVSAPVESPFGWHLVTVTEIKDATATPLADVETDIRNDLAREQAVNEAYELSNQLDDAIGGGATLEEAADQAGLTLVTIEGIDESGKDMSGNFLTDLPNPASFIRFTFDTEEGLDSLLQDDGNDGFFILRVDGLTPTRIKTLDEVKDEAIALWIAEQRRLKAQEKADAVLAQLNEGAKLNSISNDVKFATDVARPAASTRHDELPASLIQTLFGEAVGSAATGLAGNAYYVGQLDQINVPTFSADSATIKEIDEATLAGMTTDLIQQYSSALRERHSVTVNQGLVNNLTNLQY
ncbi:SurA N-terminal domain-containing protein [Curvivirga sp.]|uniref:SurA N-terminal domain-containing protein n=1 Tax=Curvivirga sp. TaxID=2856848 RepID=UPI003B59093A